jgi:hypothetical protein
MPVTDNRARLNILRGSPHSDQNNRSRHHRNRRCRVHGDAQRTMVRIPIQWMHMRHLDHGQ